MKSIGRTVLVAAALTLASSAVAHEDHAKAPAASPAMDKLKSLAGDWTMAGGDGSVTATYRVTAGGSVVMETLFPGTPHEMVTVYHQDGKDIVLTHYCAAQNQPRMKAEAQKDAEKLVFNFAGGTNLDAKKDGHMHEASIQFVDADTVHSEWTYFAGGKKQETKAFDLKRKKS